MQSLSQETLKGVCQELYVCAKLVLEDLSSGQGSGPWMFVLRFPVSSPQWVSSIK